MMPQGNTDCDLSLGVLRQYHSCTLPEYMGTISDIKVCGRIVGAAIAKFSDMSYPPSYEVLLIDAITGSTLLFDPELPQAGALANNSCSIKYLSLSSFLQTFERLALVVYPSCFVLIGVEQGTALVARAYALPSSMRFGGDEGPRGQKSVSGSSDFPIVQDRDLLITKLELFRFPSSSFDFHVSAEFGNEVSGNLSIVAFDIGIRPGQIRGYVFRVADLPLAQCRVTVQDFAIPAKTSVDKVCVGKTGRRAVWLQRHWDTDEFDVMKSTFSTSPKVGALFPKHLAFPFGPLHTCESLAFDEAAGRVAMSLLTGQLYILD